MHASNLAKFVIIYKAVRYFFQFLVGQIKQYHTVIAAFLGGYIVFGKRNNINEQVYRFFHMRNFILQFYYKRLFF